ncbi:MAG: hypothetical protein ABIJ09_10665 [Pseudomonadota bacterium]
MKDTTEFSYDVDKQIVEGFLSNKSAMYNNLGEVGYSRRVLKERAEKLGLTQSLLAQHSAGEVQLAVRSCLNCDEPFVSVGSFNRLCKRCRSRH